MDTTHSSRPPTTRIQSSVVVVAVPKQKPGTVETPPNPRVDNGDSVPARHDKVMS